MNGIEIAVYHHPNRPWKIILPESLADDVLLCGIIEY